MNYKEINEAILEGRDVNIDLVKKDASFYKYLLNNRVAFYYSRNLSTNSTAYEKAIIKRGLEFNNKYYETLSFIVKTCEENKLDYMLFKTHRYIDEAVDGDIDLLVKPDDFNRFMEVFESAGFACEEDEPQKGKCVKKGFLDIEPHVNISWRSNTFLNSKSLWDDSVTKSFRDIKVRCCTPKIELFAAAGELYYSPEYIDLHRILAGKELVNLLGSDLGVSHGSQANVMTAEYIATINGYLKKPPSGKTPVFLNAAKLLKSSKHVLGYGQVLEITFKNTVWKYRYKLVSKLPFTHEWNIEK